MPAIVTESLTKHYAGHGLLRPRQATPRSGRLAIEVQEGEVFGFLGPNGAGKSHDHPPPARLPAPAAASATVLGLDVATDGLEDPPPARLPARRHRLLRHDDRRRSCSATSRALYGRGAPLRDQLRRAPGPSGRDLGRQVRDYSRGMRQKLGIIQALQHDPELAVLDEPTEGLDPLMQRSFYDLLDERRKAGRTIFFSSHILSEVERVCDRVAIIRRGELVALSDVAELLARRRRHVEMRLDGQPPDLDGVPGISDVHVREGVLPCQLDGDPSALIAAIQGVARERPAHRAGPPRGGLHGVLRRRGVDAPRRIRRRAPTTGARPRERSRERPNPVNAALFGHTPGNRVLLPPTGPGACSCGGRSLPVIYATFGKDVGEFIKGNALLSQFAQFGGGDLFSLPGAIALGFVHPFTLLLMGIVAIGFPARDRRRAREGDAR